MAVIACQRGRKMGRRLSLNDCIVMAPGAAARRNPVVCEEGRLPIGRAVAAVAIDRGWQVIRGLEGGDDSSARRVALHALRRRPSKHALNMTSLASDLRMPAGQLKSCRRMGKLDIAAAALRIAFPRKSNWQTNSQ